VRYLDKIGHRVADVPSRVGGSLPAHVSAAGKAMLAYVDPELIDDILSRFRPRVDSAALHRELASVRMRGGLSTVRKDPADPVVCLGAPIFDHERRITGGLSLCDLNSKAPLDRYGPLLLEQAKRISLQLQELQQRTKGAPPRSSVRW
jgi:DNA-binding IclR family transcriptional regulator